MKSQDYIEEIHIELEEILKEATKLGASDIFIVAGRPVAYSLNFKIINRDDHKLTIADTQALVESIYQIAKGRKDELFQNGGDDFSITVPGISRFRVSAYIQRGSYAAVIRVISFELPNPDKIQIPKNVMKLAEKKKGLVLVTGPAGSGKSTTLACIIDRINNTQSKHIITLEDPLEYLHSHKKSIVSQREIGTDVPDYLSALRSSLRQRPDVILLGEMRDNETMSIALTAAETGHLIFSTLHTVGAANTVDRILDVFPPDQRSQIALQLSLILEAVVSQQLIPTIDGELVLATEVMTMTPAVRNMIRENKIHQLDNIINSSQGGDMMAMDTSIITWYRAGRIDKTTALTYAINRELMKKKLE